METKPPSGSYLTPSFEHAIVRDAMRPRVLSCTPDTPLITAAQRMAGEHVHALVVLRRRDGGGSPGWALLSDRELLRNAERAEELTAGQAAASDALTVAPDERLVDVAQRMVTHGASHAVVVDRAVDRPIGMLSTLDVAGILAWGRA